MWSSIKSKLANRKAVSGFRKLTFQYAEAPVGSTMDVGVLWYRLDPVNSDETDLQAKYIVAAAETAVRFNPKAAVVQIGRENLKSSLMLAGLLKDVSGNTLQCIDPDGEHPEFNSLPEEVVEPEIRKHISYSSQTAAAFINETSPAISFALINAQPDYHEAVQQYEICAAQTDSGSLIAAFDIDNEAFAGSLKAFRDVLLDQPQWTLWAHCKNLAIVRREF